MADVKVSALTEQSAPDLADVQYVVDNTGPAGAKLTTARALGLYRREACEGRLTLTAGAPYPTSVATASVAGASTLYWSPIDAGLITLFDGTRWVGFFQTELSLALSGLTTDTLYDVFVDYNAGTPALALGPAWSNSGAGTSARATALTTQNGITVLTGSTGKRWVGTLRTSSTTTTDDSTTKRFVWNTYNRIRRRLISGSISNPHGYTSTVWREWNQGTNSTRLQFVVGEAMTDGVRWNAGELTGTVFRGQCVDAVNCAGLSAVGEPTAGQVRRVQQTNQFTAGLGYHFIAVTEFGGASGALSFYNHGATVLG